MALNALDETKRLYAQLMQRAGQAGTQAMVGLGNSPIGRGLVGAQRFLESPKSFSQQAPLPRQISNIPIAGFVANMAREYPAQIIGRGILDPTTDIGKMIGAATRGQNVPYNQLKSGLTKFGYQVAGSVIPGATQQYGINMKPQEALANVAQGATPLLYAGAGSATKKLVTQPKALDIATALYKGEINPQEAFALSKEIPGFWGVVKQGVVQGAKIGGLFGLTGGLEQGRNAPTVRKQVQQAGTSTAMGVGVGAAAGGALAGTIYGIQKGLQPQTEKQAAQWLKDTFRQQTGGVDFNAKVGGKPGNLEGINAKLQGYTKDQKYQLDEMIRSKQLNYDDVYQKVDKGYVIKPDAVKYLEKSTDVQAGLYDTGNQAGFLNPNAKIGGEKPLINAESSDIARAYQTGGISLDEAQMYGYKPTAVDKVIIALKGAEPIRGKQEALYSAERARRVARVAGVGEKVPGEQGYFAQLGQLKGALPKVQFEGIRKQIGQEDIDSLFNQVEKSSLSPFEKVTAKTGLAKLLGAQGGSVPQEGELTLLNTIFPPEFTQAALDKRSLMSKLWGGTGEALNLPREVMATADVSAPMRQGIFLIGRPKQWIPAARDMFKYFGSEDAYQNLQKDIQSRPTYEAMRQGGLALTDMNAPLGGREEAFRSTLAEKIPAFGWLARASNRAYTGFLNKLRADTFDDLLKGAQENGATNIDLGGQFNNPKVVSDLASFVNNATGRGNLPAMLQKSSGSLSTAFFSPRLMASRFNLLNPIEYIRLEPYVRKEALKSLFTFAGTIMTALTLAKMSGAGVSTDPRNADFAKIKFGNTRYDIMGGFQQWLVTAYRLYSGQMVSSTTGKEFTLGEGYKPTTRKDILVRFFENKESPIASFLTGLLEGKTSIGENFRVTPEIVDRFIPMAWQDMYDLYKERGLPGIPMAIPALTGVGVQTYGNQVPIAGKTATGRSNVQWRQPPTMGEAIVNKITGTQLSNIPEDQWQPLVEQRNIDTQTKIEETKAKSTVLQTGQAQRVGNKYFYLDNGIVKTKKLEGQSYMPPTQNPSSMMPQAGASTMDQFPLQQGVTISVVDKYGETKAIQIKPLGAFPTATGHTNIDRINAQAYNSRINEMIKNVAILAQANKVPLDVAEQVISQLLEKQKMVQSQIKASRPRKPRLLKQIKARRVTARIAKFSSPKIRIPRTRRVTYHSVLHT